MNKKRLKAIQKMLAEKGENLSLEEIEEKLKSIHDAVRKILREKGYETPETDEGIEMFMMMLHQN
jgi:flagellar basal body-associated protein FliL